MISTQPQVCWSRLSSGLYLVPCLEDAKAITFEYEASLKLGGEIRWKH
jgi:hypothetical protein